MLRRSLGLAAVLVSALGLLVLVSPAALAEEAPAIAAPAAAPSVEVAQAPCGTPDLAALLDADNNVPQACGASLEVAGTPEPEFLAAGKPGYCRCGCGARCRTDADCGGAACVAFISCC